MDKKKMSKKLKKMIMESELKNNDKGVLVHSQGYTISELKGGDKKEITKMEAISILSKHFKVLDSIIKDIGEKRIKETKLTYSVLDLGSFLPVSGSKVDITIEFYT